jgi:hypothetical protein
MEIFSLNSKEWLRNYKVILLPLSQIIVCFSFGKGKESTSIIPHVYKYERIFRDGSDNVDIFLLFTSLYKFHFDLA